MYNVHASIIHDIWALNLMSGLLDWLIVMLHVMMSR